MRERGWFISVEGVDGAGKTTQVRLLAQWLQGRGWDVVATREPGGTPFGQALREVLLQSGQAVDARTEALLYAADRRHHVQAVVLPALRRGATVITSRFVDSSLVYQGVVAGLGAEAVEEINRVAGNDRVMPDLTVLLDVPPHVAVERRLRRDGGKEGDRMERRGEEFFARVRQAYLDLAGRHPGRIRVVDASPAPEEVHAQVLRWVLEATAGRRVRAE